MPATLNRNEKKIGCSASLSKTSHSSTKLTRLAKYSEMSAGLVTAEPEIGKLPQPQGKQGSELTILAKTLWKQFLTFDLIALSAGVQGWLEDVKILVESNQTFLDQNYFYKGKKEKKEVYRFIQEQPVLLPLLLEVPKRVKQYFGALTEVWLEVVSDPEYPNNNQLIAFITTELEPEKAVEKLNQMDEEWWLEVSDNGLGQLEFLLRYK